MRTAGLVARTIASRSYLPRSSRWRSSSTAGSKWSSTSVRPGATTMTTSSMPEATASSTTTWIAGRSTTGRISLGMTLEAGSMRVPSPAATITALRTFIACLTCGRKSGRSAGETLALARLLRRLATDAQRGHRTRPQPLDSDLIPAFLAQAVAAALDAREGFVDLAQQLALAIAHPEQEGTVGFERGAIGGVGAGLLGLGVERTKRSLGFLQNLALAVLEQAAEKIKLPLPHGRGPRSRGLLL